MSRNENVCVHMCLTIRKRRMRSKRDWLTQQGRQKEKEEKKEKEKKKKQKKQRRGFSSRIFFFFSDVVYFLS